VILQKLNHLEEQSSSRMEREERILEREEKRDLILENMLLYITEKLATKEDIESIRADFQQQFALERSSRAQEIKQLLYDGPRTLKELSKALNMSKSAVLYHLNKMNIDSSGFIKKPGRGRPEKIYQLYVGDKD